MSKRKDFKVTKEMVRETKYGNLLMLELRVIAAVLGTQGFNQKFHTHIEGIKDIPFNIDITPKVKQ